MYMSKLHLSTLNLSVIRNLKFCRLQYFVLDNLKTLFRVQFVGVSLIHGFTL